MPVPGLDGRPAQLIDIASMTVLERALNAKGVESGFLWTSPDQWNEIGDALDTWLATAGRGLAYATVAASSVIDFEAAIIDGWMPPDVRARLVEATAAAVGEIDVEGIRVPAIREGTVGIHARALGGASLPLSERFLIGSTAAAKGL